MLTQCWLSVAVITLALTIGLNSATAQVSNRSRQRWVTGNALRQRLSSPIDVAWVDTPLRPAISRLEQSFQIAFFLDRRIDPGLKVNFSSKVEHFSNFVDVFAREHRLHSFWLGPIAYIGHEVKTECGAVRLDVQADYIANQLPRKVSRFWQRKKSLRWPNLTEPKQLVAQIGKDAGIKVVDVDRVPHDLWLADDLPALSVANRLGIILLGFGLSFDVNADGSATIVQIDPSEIVTLDYPLSARLANPIEDLKLELTGAAVRVDRAVCSLTGSLEQHVRLRHWIRSNKPTHKRKISNRDSAESYQVYSLNIQEQPFQPVIESLARRLQLTTEWQPAISNDKKMQRVSFQVQNATQEELLDAATSSAGVRYRVDGNTLKIYGSSK